MAPVGAGSEPVPFFNGLIGVRATLKEDCARRDATSGRGFAGVNGATGVAKMTGAAEIGGTRVEDTMVQVMIFLR